MYEIIIGRSKSEIERLGTKGTIFLARHYVRMGQVTSLTNKIYLDVNNTHVVFIAGKRGSGKCLSEDTLVTLENGLEIPIKDIEKIDEKILGINEKFKIGSQEKSDFYKRTVNEMLYIKLRSGREIKLTPEHPLLTIDGWNPAEDLSIKSRIATPRKIIYKGNEKLPVEHIKLLAYLITESHTKKSTLFSNSDEKIVKDFKISLNFLHPLLKIIKNGEFCYKVSSKKIKRKILGFNLKRNIKGQFKKGTSIRHEKTKIRDFTEEYGLYGLSSLEKFVPSKIFQLNKKQISLFLNRLFSCDGSIYKTSNSWEISYSSSSKKLAKQVHSLLLRFEILSKLRSKKMKYLDKYNDNYEVVINGEFVNIFIEEIGFFGKKKKKQKIALEEIKGIKRNTNIDTIPKEIWNNYRPNNWAEIGKTLNYNIPKSARSSINYSPSRLKLLKIAKKDESQKMKLLAESDIFWDEIIEIKKLEGNFTVYDITVPKVHNFVANNIIVHNSYTMGAIAEGIVSDDPEFAKNLAVIMFDTMGVYWTMKYPNRKDEDLLREWGLEPKGLPIKIFTPYGFFDEFKEKGIPTDFAFSIKPSELTTHDWCGSFNIEINSPTGVYLTKIMNIIKEEKENYSLQDIADKVKQDQDIDSHTKNSVINLFEGAEAWGLFKEEGTKINDLVIPGTISVLDVSCYATSPLGAGLRALVVGIVAQKMFTERMNARRYEEFSSIDESMHFFKTEKTEEKDKMPLVWLILDEAHEFLPVTGRTPASEPLITLLREGRQPGISMILATQQPGKIHTDVMTQSDTIISHLLTAKIDTDALGTLMQSYLRTGLDELIDQLPKVAGAAIILDDKNSKMYPTRVRPRISWHGGSSPTALGKQ